MPISAIKRVATMGVKIFLWSMWALVLIIWLFAYYLAQPVRTPHVLYVPAGRTDKIITYLASQKLDLNLLDRYLIALIGYPQNGWIDLEKSYQHKGDFLYRLTHAKAAMVSITLIPGETKELFFAQIAQKLGLDLDKLFQAYHQYAPVAEGVIWPDTYYIPKGIDEERLIHFLVSESLHRHKQLSIKFFGDYRPNQWFRYVTIASIIQKEAFDPKEMPLVAGVIYNRLKKKMPLQMDGSLNYGRFSHRKITKARIRHDQTLFNTYRNRGLPPYPVGSVSFEALKAAIKPANVKYLYFVRGKNGPHIFTTTYRAHIKAIRSVNK